MSEVSKLLGAAVGHLDYALSIMQLSLTSTPLSAISNNRDSPFSFGKRVGRVVDGLQKRGVEVSITAALQAVWFQAHRHPRGCKDVSEPGQLHGMMSVSYLITHIVAGV